MSSELTQQNPATTCAKPGRGMLIVVSSPSGGGKGTLIDRVLQTVAGVSYSVSYTTRTPRAGEKNGREYFFVDRKSTRLNSSHTVISYAVFCLKKKKIN